MCNPAFLPALQAAGAAAAIGGSLIQGIAGYQTGQAQAKAYNAQAVNEARLASIQDQRERDQFQAQIAQQRAELAARGVQLDSVTAVMLGRKAAAEMSYQSQATEAQTWAHGVELTNAAKLAQADALNSLLTGGISAAAYSVQMAPDIWPGLQGSGLTPDATRLAGG